MKLIALLLVCISLSAVAEKSPFDANVENTTVLNPGCPVTLTGIYAGSPGREGIPISVHFVNQTDMRLVGIKVGLIGYDATRDPHSFPQQYAIAVNLKPQKEAKPVWKVQEDDFALNTASGARVYIDKLLFSNGATWSDDGTHSCSLKILGRAKPHKNRDE